MNRSRCSACPVATDLPCPAITKPHPRYCELAAQGHEYDAILNDMATRMASGPASPSGWPDIPIGFPVRNGAQGRVRVGIVSPCCGIGGAERHISDMLDHCDGSRIQWVGIAIRHPTDPPNLREDWEAHCPVATGDHAIARLARACDVLYTWGVLDLPWGIPPSRLAELVPAGLPILTCSQGSLEYESHMDPAAISDAFPVAVSAAAVRSVPRVKRDQTRVIYNLAAPARGRTGKTPEQIRRELGIPEGVKVAGWLGRLSGEKGPRNYARGIAALPDDWVGVMAGNGAEEWWLREFAATLPSGKLRLIGPRSDMGDLLTIFACMLMTSQTEGCSLAAGEALVDGVPLVSTQVGLLEDHPELARLLPADPTGEQIATAILADQMDPIGTADRVARAKAFAACELGVERFSREWTEVLCGLYRPAVTGASPSSASLATQGRGQAGKPSVRPDVVDHLRLAKLRRECPHGTKPPGCGCSDELICGAGKGDKEGRASRAACYLCIGEREQEAIACDSTTSDTISGSATTTLATSRVMSSTA